MDAQNTQIIQEKRKRGGVSMPCPECGANTHVIQTRRNDDKVWRDRQCLKKGRHRFWTVENVFLDDALDGYDDPR